jgi:uncharacterized damage-inducible protein DinB
MDFLEMYGAEFDLEMKSTRKMLECVQDEKMNWRPHEKSMSLARLASHVAELPGRTVQVIELDTLVRQPGFKHFCAESREELLKKFDESSEAGRAAIAGGVTDERLTAIWGVKFGEKTVLEMPRTMALRRIVLDHLIHHRAQLSVYFRLLDVKIPGMYGPSADEIPLMK